MTETTSTAAAKPEGRDADLLGQRGGAGVAAVDLHSHRRERSGPVRQMRAATRQLAAGKVAVQVERGGIRELMTCGFLQPDG